MSFKVLVISFKTLTILSSVDDDWFIRPYWGELELGCHELKHELTRFKDCWKYLSEILEIVRSCAQ
jgi:hypothetical protein